MKAIAYKSKSGRQLFKQSMSEQEYMECDESYIGYCLACGEERSCCEPDARKYECEACGEHMVYGASELLLMGLLTFEPKE